MGFVIDRVRELVKLAPSPVIVRTMFIPGIGTGAAYASGDAFGDKFIIDDIPVNGTISNLTWLDFDDEGLNKELVLFSADFTATADNAVFAVSDADLNSCVTTLAITNFFNFGNNQIGTNTPGFSYYAPKRQLFCQVVTRGADNIAAGADPKLIVTVV